MESTKHTTPSRPQFAASPMKAGGDAAPFDLGDDDAYEDWRRQKLKNFPVPPEALVAAARDALKSVLDGRGRLIYRARFMDRVAGS